MHADENGLWLPASPLELRAACLNAIEAGAVACTFAGELVACNVTRLTELATSVELAPPPPQADGTPGRTELEKLAICRRCEHWQPAAHACGLLTRSDPDGSDAPCWNRLRERIVRGLPCPHSAGDKWS